MAKHELEPRCFTGFSRQTFLFLKDLKANNDKAWFGAHRPDYEQSLLQPLRDLVTDLTDAMLDIDPCFEVSPTVNKTISRIHRDTRFSKDKSPYRDCMWIVFKRSGKEWSRWGVGYFLEINPTWYRYGMGFYEAAPDIMAEFRARIDDHPKAFLKAISWFQDKAPFVLEGESYKRHKGPDKSEPILSWYNHKSFYLSSRHKIDKTIQSPALVDTLIHDFKLCAPLYHYLRETILKTKQMK
jgi:uncharacterized protein (TIGR02453 family)